MLENIIGHTKQINYFKNIIRDNTYLHAYLFEGVSGIGKKTLALGLIKTLLCKEQTSLKLFDAGNLIDFLLVRPENNEIKTEDVQKIHEFLLSSPIQADKKVVLIDDCEKMNLHAQNKILKIIEEPPSYAMFFLITSNRQILADTLLSRLIRISFNALSTEQIKLYAEKNNIVFDQKIADLSNGSVSKYLELLNEGERIYDFVKELLEALKTKNNLKIFNCLKEAEQYKDRLYDLLDALEFISIQNQDMGAAKLSRFMQIIAETRVMYSRNLHKNLLISNLILNMQGVFK